MAGRLRRWTEPERARLIELFVGGMIYRRIAEELGHPIGSVATEAARLQGLGLLPRRQVISAFRLRRWTEPERARLIELFVGGMIYRRIAEELGRPIGSVATEAARLQGLGLLPRRQVISAFRSLSNGPACPPPI